MAADVVQYESNNIKCYASAFSNIFFPLSWKGSHKTLKLN